MAIKQITPPDAHQLIEAGSPYVDVRTEAEFAGGHPTTAVNIPVVFTEPATGQSVPNTEFLSVAERHFPKDSALILGCGSGARSQRAAEILSAAGYSNVSNMQGGFGGARDASGRTIVPGWAESGLPVSSECTDANTYAGLKGGRT